VHIAPTFGADDYRIAAQHGISALLVTDKAGNQCPLVDKKGRFFPIEDLDPDFVARCVNTQAYSEFQGKYVKNEYDESLSEKDPSIDVHISVMLKQKGLAFRVEKYVHTYPHCWRTDKPVLYYPLDSWFIKTTAAKERMIELNKTIQWKPESTGTGRFGKWLENLQDWNLSRSRYWGTPLPIWATADKTELKCIGSVAELKKEIEKSIAAGYMSSNPLHEFKDGDYSEQNYSSFDLHRPYCDSIILVSASGQEMWRETDLIDVWFDSGAMPYAQLHYPFENKEIFEKVFPADFIAEGVDQTRGWFFTLHAISTMLFDSVAFKTVVSNGLILAKDGAKMSKRLDNTVDPFDTIEKYGTDPLRWYMVTNASPWDNLKFDIEGVEEAKRKFFGTLYNTYSFFALYANVDSFCYSQEEVPVGQRPELDRWILSLLNSLIQQVTESLEAYEPTKAGRAIQDFVCDNLSNWYVRLSRKRFWGTELSQDKISAYQTLCTCLEQVARLMAPIAPFYADRLFCDIQTVTGKDKSESVHLAMFPKTDASLINHDLETKMELAQNICSMVLALRRRVSIKVRQPLGKIMVPVLNETQRNTVAEIQEIIKSEVNVKEVLCLDGDAGIVVKKAKANFKLLGPKYGKQMKQVADAIAGLGSAEVTELEKNGELSVNLNGQAVNISLQDVEIVSEDIPGWLVANEGSVTVALDITVTEELRGEGIAREFVNRIQNFRKEMGLEVTDKIMLSIKSHPELDAGIESHKEYIQRETQAIELVIAANVEQSSAKTVDIADGAATDICISKA
jgi:isoleucyl-tRNA synthetase